MITRKDIQFMRLCLASAGIFSTCGKKKYCAVLVDDYGHIVGMGYNGGPRGAVHCEDGGCPRYIEGSPSGSVYDNCIAIHAEANAFLHSDYSSRAKKLYVNGPPCFNCAKLICNSTVKEVFYLRDDSYNNWKDVKDFLEKSLIKVKEVPHASI